MDCTYKTNRFKYPLLEIVGVTSTHMTFLVAHAFLTKETKCDYAWVLRQLMSLSDGWQLPSVASTDRDLGLIAVVEDELLDATHLLCSWHVNKNIVAKTNDLFSKDEDYNTWYEMWINLVQSQTESTYNGRLAELEAKYVGVPRLLDYVNDTRLCQKEKFKYAWTNNVLYFGNATTNRVEGVHNVLKRELQTSQGHFGDAFKSIHDVLTHQ